MKKLIALILMVLPLAGCSASIGIPTRATSTTYTTPVVSGTAYVPAGRATTVTKTYY